jgi:hypothetical protein
MGQPGTVYAFARLDDSGKYGDDVLIGVGRDDEECWGAEGTMSIDNAERLRDVLDRAIRYARRQQRIAPVRTELMPAPTPAEVRANSPELDGQMTAVTAMAADAPT